MIAWEGWTLRRVFHIASDIPDGTPDCAEMVASNGGLDANILQEVVNRTNHLGVSKKEHVHDGQVIVQ
ncbi:hypothetical protein V8E54_010845 [Elaphomyces granulatus]